MKLSPHSSPAEPADLLIRMHNQVGAAVDVTGHYRQARWYCHGCGESSEFPAEDIVSFTRRKANDHAGQCRAAYHHLHR
ncbi:hypothetical protein ACFTXM_26580 [Streptomyces sp. NPDC056930]|uniref:hypothetical protein n=1 Tax=Streptomyces sp. NPDC056930 TaxID=3345967 RepID=UPI0036376CEF